MQQIFSLGFGRGWRAPTVPGIIIIQTILSFPRDDPRRSVVLQLLVTWKISLEITQDFEQEEVDTMVQLSQAYVEWEERTKQEGVDQGERSMVLRLLSRKMGELSIAVRSKIDRLSLPQLENLGEALLDFSSIQDLEDWLAQHSDS